MFNTSPVIVEKIRSLSQDFGMTDQAIADEIGYHRVSVQRIRKQYGIGRKNLSNKVDKEVTCPVCGGTYVIKRSGIPMICCPKCQEEYNKKIAEEYGVTESGD